MKSNFSGQTKLYPKNIYAIKVVRDSMRVILLRFLYPKPYALISFGRFVINCLCRPLFILYFNIMAPEIRYYHYYGHFIRQPRGAYQTSKNFSWYQFQQIIPQEFVMVQIVIVPFISFLTRFTSFIQAYAWQWLPLF